MTPIVAATLLGSAVLLPASVAGAELSLVPMALGSNEAARLDALVDAGIERYRAGSYREAIAILNLVLTARPDVAEAQLYVSLSYMALGEETMAEPHLVALGRLPVKRRLREQVDSVLEVIRAGPLSPPVRRLIAAALDETMSAQRSPRRRPSPADALLRRNFPYFP